jgi:hypothetical protein
MDSLEERALKNRPPVDEETKKKRRRGIVWLVGFFLFWLAVGYVIGSRCCNSFRNRSGFGYG